MHRPISLLCAALASVATVGCSDGEIVAPVPLASPIAFAPMGSLGLDSGKGGFRFGAASAATQIEDQNPHTDWYVFTQPESEGGLGNGAAFVGDAALGYTSAIEDVALLSAMHLDSYRFSIEWARVEPQRDVIDEEALAHYSDLIDALLAAGIRPLITIHHFANPVWVDDPRDVDCVAGPTDANLCGPGHPEGGPLVVEEIGEHARLLAERFGDRIDEWGTLNEPVNYLLAAYGIGTFPPGKSMLFDVLGSFIPVVRDYISEHAAIYRAIKEADGVDADGDGDAASVGLSLSVGDFEPARDNAPSSDPEDVSARDRLVYVYHYLVVEALRQGRFDADLDGELEEDQPGWKDTLDWLGVQYYFRAGVTGDPGLVPVLELTPCFGTFDLGACLPPADPSFCVPAMGYEYWAPGLFEVLADLGARWPDLPLVVTESGIATEEGRRRAENVVRALEQIERARQSGVDVRGYYHWSLFDNFEWAEGFGPRFGLYRVDYDTYQRTATDGAEVLGSIAGGRTLSAEQRATYGGEGPMTPEPGYPPRTLCNSN
jgi:beta-glucosidase